VVADGQIFIDGLDIRSPRCGGYIKVQKRFVGGLGKKIKQYTKE
jgi:hypothetical protein